MHRANDDIRPPLRQRLPGTAQYAIYEFQARYAVMLVEGFNEGSKERKRKRIVHTDDQFVLPAFVKFDGLLFQLDRKSVV